MQLTELVPQSCRVCLQQAPKLRSLYKPLDEGEEPPNEMLRLLTGIELENADAYETLPKCICKSCELSLSMAYQFRDKVLHTHQIIEIYRKRMWCTEELEYQQSIENTPTKVKEELDEVGNSNDFKDENSDNEELNEDMKEEMLELTINEMDSFDTEHIDEEEMLEINVEEDMEEECKSEYLYDEEYCSNADATQQEIILQAEEQSATEEVVAFSYELDSIASKDDVDELHIVDTTTERLEPEEIVIPVKLHATKSSKVKPKKDKNDGDGSEERIEQFPQSKQNIESTATTSVKKTNSVKESTAHICDICGNIFAKRGRMMEHRRRHDKELRYACEICDKRFHLREKLRKHMFLHAGGKPYKCSFCSRTFFYESMKKAHEAVHSGIKPYVCDECNKAFAYAHALVKHKLIHADIKLYHCEYCDKDFRLQHHMKQHMETKLHQNAVYAMTVGNAKLTAGAPPSNSYAQNTR